MHSFQLSNPFFSLFNALWLMWTRLRLQHIPNSSNSAPNCNPSFATLPILILVLWLNTDMYWVDAGRFVAKVTGMPAMVEEVFNVFF